MANEDTLLRHVSSGLAGWISFHHAAGRRSLDLEHFLYPPVFEIAFGQNWTVVPQFPIPTAGQNPKTIDFLFRRRKRIKKVLHIGLAALEIKRVRSRSQTRFWSDVRKLRSVQAEQLGLRRDYGELRRFLMLIGTQQAIDDYFSSDRAGAREFRGKFGDDRLNNILSRSRTDCGWLRRGPMLPDEDRVRRQTVLVFKVDQ